MFLLESRNCVIFLFEDDVLLMDYIVFLLDYALFLLKSELGAVVLSVLEVHAAQIRMVSVLMKLFS